MTKFKKRIALALVCLLTLASNAQNKFATLSGEIKNYDNQSFLVDSKSLGLSMDTISVKFGKFSASILIDYPCVKHIDIGRFYKPLYLMPGKSLNFNFDLSKGDGAFRYSGDLATENVILDSLNQRFWTRLIPLRSLPARIAAHSMDSAFAEEKKYLDAQIAKNKVDPSFAEYVKGSLDYQCAGEKFGYGYKQAIKDSSFYSFTSKMTIESEKFLDSHEYRIFLNDYLSNNVFNKLDSTQRKSNELVFNTCIQEINKFTNLNIKENCLLKLVYSDLEYGGVEGFEKEYDYFKKHNTDSVYAQQIRKLYAKKMVLASGNVAPPFICTDIDGKEVSLSDFKGKIVYLDFWATWCGGCRMDMPYLKKLQSEYKDKNIVFVSISMNSNIKDWKDFINEKKMEGINLFIGNKGFDSEVARSYQVFGIPSYKLIDKEGIIIDAGAPRPSSDEIRKVINDLLDRK
jgi:thiol-disulfide isomerase/thioredoxin